MSLGKYIKEINKIIEMVENHDMTFTDKLKSLCDTMTCDEALNNSDKVGKSQIKIINKFIKSTKDDNQITKKMYYDDDMYCYTNGYVAIELYKPVAGIPLADKEEPTPIKFHNIITDVGNNVFMEEVQIDEAEIKKAIVENKTRTKKQDLKPFIIQNKSIKIGFNPEWYQDIVNCLGGNCKVLASTQNALHPIYIEGELGKAVLLPIKLVGNNRA